MPNKDAEERNRQRRERYSTDGVYQQKCRVHGIESKRKSRESRKGLLGNIDGELFVGLQVSARHVALSCRQLDALERMQIIPPPGFMRTLGGGKRLLFLREEIALLHAALSCRVTTRKAVSRAFDLPRMKETLALTWPYPKMLPVEAFAGLPFEAFEELLILSLRFDRAAKADRRVVARELGTMAQAPIDVWEEIKKPLAELTRQLVTRRPLCLVQLRALLLGA